MTIDGAIKLLTYLHGTNTMPLLEMDRDAVKLGIEALKRIREHRAEFGNIPTIKLQGETR